MTDAEARKIGLQAVKELELTNQAYDGLRAALIEELIATSPDQSAKRERIYGALHSMTLVRKALADAVVAGRTAEGMINNREILSQHGFSSPY